MNPHQTNFPTLPTVPDVSSELASMPEQQLLSLANDEDAFLRYTESHKFYQDVQAALDSVTESNRLAVEEILRKQPVVAEMQGQLQQLRATHDNLLRQFNELSGRLKAKTASHTAKPQVIEQLENELSTLSAESDALDSRFCSEGMAVAEYVKLGLELKKKVATIRLKISNL
ncbi:hypothetical protein RCL1_001289 [Eukaryota sp. TZLM3-RCL]